MTFSNSWIYRISENNHYRKLSSDWLFRKTIVIFLIAFIAVFCFPRFLYCQDKTKNIEIILDASGSMNNEIEGGKKIDIAKEVIVKMLSVISPQTTSYIRIGLRAFGEERDIDPEKDSRLLVPIQEVNLETFEKALSEITPKGYSPIAYSILMAGYDFPLSGEKMIILITDGRETCGGDAVKTIKRLQREGINIMVNIIGYNVDKKDEDSLREITSISGGTYNNAVSAESLEINFEEMVGSKNFVKKTERKEIVKKLEEKKFLKIKKPEITEKPEEKVNYEPEKLNFKRDEWTERNPVTAMKYSLIFPGLGQIYTDRFTKGIIDFTVEWIMFFNNYNVTQLHEYRTQPQASFTKDFLDFSCVSYYISGGAGAYFYTKNRNNQDHWKMKSAGGAFLRSIILPGWGQLYIGDNPEAGFSYMCWAGFFYYKVLHPVPRGVEATDEERENIKSDCRTILGGIYGLQFLTVISADAHNTNAGRYHAAGWIKNKFEVNFGFLNGSDLTPKITVQKRF